MWITGSRFSCRTSSHSHELNLTDGHFHLIVAIIFILSNNPNVYFMNDCRGLYTISYARILC